MAGDPPLVEVVVADQLVSIRARHRWRAILSSANSRAELTLFQSAPAIDGGRSACALGAFRHSAGFNPRPPSMAGDPGSMQGTCWGGQFQSAPAIDGGRSAGRRCQGASRRRFNPRPPSMAGDPWPSHHLQLTGHVSIRARHRWRAIQGSPARGWMKRMFQSAPAIDGGRSVVCGVPAARRKSFNPRPPSMAGDPRVLAAAIGYLMVSIRARHRWRAIQQQAREAESALTVSIRARHRWRAIPHHKLGGDHFTAVSIRARHRWRAILRPVLRGTGVVFVSIRARHRWRAIRCWRAAVPVR